MKSAETLLAMHRRAWNADPLAIVTAPGRVNLMGDHVDYAHVPVLPMAIQLGTRVGVGPGTDGRLRGISSAARGLLYLRGDEAPTELDGWAQYAAAAVAAAGMPESGAVITVGGDLPITGGLSSSSAFVLATVAALTIAQGTAADLERLVELAVAAERSIGVEGGSMDQIVIAHASRGNALRIDFEPPGRRQVPIHEGLAWVIASSGEAAPKGSRVRAAYNALAVTARAVAVLVGSSLGRAVGRPPRFGSIGLNASGLEEAIDALPLTTTARAVADVTHTPVTDMTTMSAGAFDPDVALELQRFGRHLLSEGRRVDAVEAALLTGDLAGVGHAMAESHASLASIGVVTPGLARVVDAMCDAGAAGARVTGAGFGGYAVAVCSPDQVAVVRNGAVDATGGPAVEVRPSEGLHYG